MRLRYKPWAIPELEENKLVYFDPKENKGRWKEVFGNNNPIHLDIGAGRGKFSTIKAQNNPNINYVAIEFDAKAFVYAGRKFEEAGLTNIRGIKDIAQKLSEFFEENEVDKLYINFSNPWPKRSQHKRRLTHPLFLRMYKNILKNGGEIEYKTDNRDFFEDSLVYFEKMGFEIIEKTRDLKPEDKPDNIVTEYEEKWRGMGVPICYAKIKNIK